MVTESPARSRLSGVAVPLLVNQLSVQFPRVRPVVRVVGGVSRSQTSALEETSWIRSALPAGQALATWSARVAGVDAVGRVTLERPS